MDNVTIAKTILQQLGGRRFTVMTGAKHIFAIANGLSFKLPSKFAQRGINYVEIVLNSMDLYDIKFCKIKRARRGYLPAIPQVVTVATCEGIYCDMISTIFKRETGLDTSL